MLWGAGQLRGPNLALTSASDFSVALMFLARSPTAPGNRSSFHVTSSWGSSVVPVHQRRPTDRSTTNWTVPQAQHSDVAG